VFGQVVYREGKGIEGKRLGITMNGRRPSGGEGPLRNVGPNKR